MSMEEIVVLLVFLVGAETQIDHRLLEHGHGRPPGVLRL